MVDVSYVALIRPTRVVSAILTAMLIGISDSSAATVRVNGGPEFIDDEILVRVADPEKRSQTLATVRQRYRAPDAPDEECGNTGVYRVRGIKPEVVIAGFQDQPFLEIEDGSRVEPNFGVNRAVQVSDAITTMQWGMFKDTNGIDAEGAWAQTKGSFDIAVAVTDTGVWYAHDDFRHGVLSSTGKSNIFASQFAFIPEPRTTPPRNQITCPIGTHGFNVIGTGAQICDPNATATEWHGTHIAGTIGAVGNNGRFIAGINWNSTIVPVKFLDEDGRGNVCDAARAISFAVLLKSKYEVPLRVISAAWTTEWDSEALRRSLTEAKSQQILVVAAAGNDGLNNDNIKVFPANYGREAAFENVISVAGSDSEGWDPLESTCRHASLSIL